MTSRDDVISTAEQVSGSATWAIRGGRLLHPDAPSAVADLVISGDRIVAIVAAGSFSAGPVLDADGLDVLPGAIDLHVHLRDPGQTHKETVETGTAAAAAGGTTLVCDMPSTQPQVVTAAVYADKRRSWTGRAAVDFALWAGGTDAGELRAMARAGAIGVKIYMATSPGFELLYSADIGAARRVLETSAEIGWAVSVHVGDQAASDAHRDRLIATGRHDPGAVLEVTRGPGNLAGMARLLDLATELETPVHLAHLSAYGTEALELFLRARRGSRRLTAETCVPALSEEDDLPRLGVRVLPTVFSAAARQRFVVALANGDIDAIATDHAPHTREEKARGRDDAWAAAPGYPALETSPALAYDVHLRGELSSQRLADSLAAAPARILGLPDRGRLRPGCQADLVLADPAGSWRVDETALHAKVGWSPFHGRTLRGRLHATYLRGRPVAHDGEILDQGGGRFVGRPPVSEADGEARP